MDTAQGKKNLLNFGKATVSLVSDATIVFGWIVKATGATASTAIKITSKVGNAADNVGYTWSGVESIEKLAGDELQSFNDFFIEALGYAPIAGTARISIKQ